MASIYTKWLMTSVISFFSLGLNMNTEIVTLSENSLSTNIAQLLHKRVIIPKKTTFSDGEVEFKFDEGTDFTGKKVVVIQSTYPPVDKKIINICLVSHLIHNLNAQSVVQMLPYMGYSRHDKSYIKGKPGPVQSILNILESANIKYLFTVELHDENVQDFCKTPIINIDVNEVIAQHVQQTIPDLSSCCFIAPDKGAKEQVKDIADLVGCQTLVFSKKRYDTNKTRVMGVEGNCKGKYAIIVDDIIDTGGTALNVCEELKKQGFETIYGYFIHAVLSGNAEERLEKSSFDKIFISNSIPLQTSSKKIEVFDISKPIAASLIKHLSE